MCVLVSTPVNMVQSSVVLGKLKCSQLSAPGILNTKNMFSPPLLGMRKNMFLPLKTTRKRGQRCKDRSLVVTQLFAMSTRCLWADTDAFILLAERTHWRCQPLCRQKTSLCMHPVNACSAWHPLLFTFFDCHSLSVFNSHSLFLSLLILSFFLPVVVFLVSALSLNLPCAFIWLYFCHQTWQFVIVDTIRSDLQRAPSLWTFASFCWDDLHRQRTESERGRGWENNDEYLAQGWTSIGNKSTRSKETKAKRKDGEKLDDSIQK